MRHGFRQRVSDLTPGFVVSTAEQEGTMTARGEMGLVMFSSRYLPCPECGGTIDQAMPAVHECLRARLAEHQVAEPLDGVEQFEADLQAYLATTAGRFETWIAARKVRQSA
jgi:hypothetical protein